MANKKSSPAFSYPTIKVFAAAALAYKANNAYFKDDKIEYFDIENGESVRKVTPRNLTLMKEYLSAEIDPCSEENYEEARQIIEYYQSKLLDLMSGKLNSYSQAATHVANKETINELVDLGLIASLPKAYRNSVKFDQILESKEKALNSSTHFGSVGETYQGKARVISSVYSQKWFRYFHTAQDVTTNNVINFSSNTELEIGAVLHIKGRIKDHVNGNVTRLNYVKVSVDAAS